MLADDIPYFYAAAAGLLLLLVIWLFYRRFRRVNAAAILIDETLKAHSQDELRDLVIPDGIGGVIEIERLVKLDQGLLIVETYPISGHLFGADHIDQWTQIIDGRSFKFANPLQHIYNIRESLRMLVPKIPVFCRVVFTADSNFPKGKPQEASVLATLAEDLQALFEQPATQEKVDDAWQRIMRIGRKNGQSLTKR